MGGLEALGDELVRLLLSRAAVRMNAWLGLSQVANRRGSHGGSAHGTNGRDPVADLDIGKSNGRGVLAHPLRELGGADVNRVSGFVPTDRGDR